jgi:hypothetical protein
MAGYQHARLFVFPVVVTNASLSICRFDPGNIRIEDGTLDVAHAQIETVPFIRFRKTLATVFPNRQLNDLRAANRARERTIFVVTAAHIAAFLKGWKVDPLTIGGFAIQKRR